MVRLDCPKRKEYTNIKPQHKGFNTTRIFDCESLDNVGAFAASVESTSQQMDKWLIDSGASSHMTWEKNILTGYKEFERVQKVSVGDGRTRDAVGVGDVHINMQFKVSQPKGSVIYQALLVPDLACNLFSVELWQQEVIM